MIGVDLLSKPGSHVRGQRRGCAIQARIGLLSENVGREISLNREVAVVGHDAPLSKSC